MPSGVNAQSWLGFEQRIQQRRYRALLEAIDKAIAERDVVGARIAFEEARELRPEAAELIDIDARLAAMPLAHTADGHAAWSRWFGAVMMLLVGVSLLMGIEWLRDGERPLPAATPVVASPELRMASPVRTATPEEPAVTIVPPPPVEDLLPAPQQEAVGTSGGTQQIRTLSGQGRLRSASTLDSAPTIPRGEIPDDFVFVPPRRVAPASPSVPRAAQVTPRPAAPAASPSVSAAAVAPARDESRVAAVLNQYARAYEELDAGAARAVWPSVDERALARAFNSLASQSVSFEDCAIDVRGARANASCRGTASYVGKIGSREPRTEPRTWRFELRRDGEAWKIENAEARRQ